MQELKFKIRCSQIGKIMAYPDKNELPKGAKTYCETWLKEQIFQRKKEFSSKFMEKGNLTEEQSINFVADQLGYGILIKNEQFFENDFMTGTPDLITNNEVIDVKNSWDCFTFPMFDTKMPNKDYYWQGMGYMGLTGRDKFKLVYVLSDTPEHLIIKEAKNHCFRTGEEYTDEVLNAFFKLMTYDDIDDKIKIKTYEFSIEKVALKQIENRVKLCQKYINELVEKLYKDDKRNK